jgi:hypothetical protein
MNARPLAPLAILLLLGFNACSPQAPVLTPAGSRVEIVTGEPDRSPWMLAARLELRGNGGDLGEALSNVRIRARNIAARYGGTLVKLDQTVRSHWIQSRAEVTLFGRMFMRR